MNYLVPGVGIKLYYNSKVYSPAYSSVNTILLADKLIKDGNKPDASICDVGCGTGIVGLGIQKLNPSISLTMCDIDFQAIKVARLNTKRLGMSAHLIQTDMLPEGTFDIVCANMPTFSDEDMSQDLHGPDVAYYAGSDPLRLYRKLFSQAHGRTKALVCECQTKYQEPFLKLAQDSGWELVLTSEMSFAFIKKRPKNLSNLQASS